MLQLYNFEHNIGWHFYDIPALVVLIAAIIIVGVHFYRQRKREKDFDKQMKQDEFGVDL